MEDTNRTEELLCNCISYIFELKARDNIEERIGFFKEIIGLTDEEIKRYDLDTEW